MMTLIYEKTALEQTFKKALDQSHLEFEKYAKAVADGLTLPKKTVQSYTLYFTGSRLVPKSNVDHEKDFLSLSLAEPKNYEAFIKLDTAYLKKVLAKNLSKKMTSLVDSLTSGVSDVWNNYELAPTLAQYLLDSGQIQKFFADSLHNSTTVKNGSLNLSEMGQVTTVLHYLFKIGQFQGNLPIVTTLLSNLSQRSFDELTERADHSDAFDNFFEDPYVVDNYTGFFHLSDEDTDHPFKKAKLLITTEDDFKAIFKLHQKDLSALVLKKPIVDTVGFQRFLDSIKKDPIRVIDRNDVFIKGTLIKKESKYVLNVPLANQLALKQADPDDIIRGRVPQISQPIPHFSKFTEAVDYAKRHSVLGNLLTDKRIVTDLRRHFSSVFSVMLVIEATSSLKDVLKAYKQRSVGYNYYASQNIESTDFTHYHPLNDVAFIKEQLAEVGIDPSDLTALPADIQTLLK